MKIEISEYRKIWILDDDGNVKERHLRFDLKREGTEENEKVELNESEIAKMNWLRKIPGYSFVGKEETKEVLVMLQKDMQTDCIAPIIRYENPGWHKTNGRWQFLFSNCSISKEGMNHENCSLTSSMYLILGREFTLDKNYLQGNFLKVMNVLHESMDVMYPVFLSNVASVLNGILKEDDLSPSLVMWLQGKPGTGKTELAVALGCYIKPGKNLRKTDILFSANAIPRNLVNRIRRNRGVNFLLDDVKKEKVAGQADKARKCLDTCIRSVFAQRIVDTFSSKEGEEEYTRLDAGAIITAENLELPDSSKARMTYIPIGNFINESKGSAALKKFQDNPSLLAEFMAGFIYFICIKMEESPTWVAAIEEKILNDWEMHKQLFQGSNQSRLARSRAMLQCCNYLVQEYGRWVNADMLEGENNFFFNAEILLTRIMKQTAALVDEANYILYDAVKQVMQDMQIVIAQDIDMEDSNDINLSIWGYCLNETDEGIYIPQLERFLGGEGNTEVILLKENCFLEKLNISVKSVCDNLQWDTWLLNRITLSRLRDAEIIVAETRQDESHNNQIKYPMRIENEEVEDVKCVILNLRNPVFKNFAKDMFERQENEIKLISDFSYSIQHKIERLQKEMRGDLKKSMRRIKNIYNKIDL